jgi:hypothetical protein
MNNETIQEMLERHKRELDVFKHSIHLELNGSELNNLFMGLESLVEEDCPDSIKADLEAVIRQIYNQAKIGDMPMF